MLSACSSNSPPKTAEINKANDAPALPAAQSGNTSQRLDTKLNIQFDWWKLLQSPQLNSLIEQAFNANASVEAAQGTLLKLQQNDIVREGYFYFPVSVEDAANGQGRLWLMQDIPSANEAKFIGDAYYNLHAWQLEVGYLPELLRVPKQSASSKTEAEESSLQLEATYRTLADNLIASLVQEASLRAQMVAARKIVAIEQSLLAIARKQQQAGQATQADLLARQQSAELATQALLRLKGQFEQVSGALHFLLNLPADSELPEMLTLASLHLSTELPQKLSASLIQQRADVRATELEMFPADTKYKSTADIALKDVENTLFAIYNDAITLKAADTSEQENSGALQSARKQYAASKASYQAVLIAELNVQFATLRAVQARTKYLGNAIALYHALGGGWWTMDDALRLEIDNELR